MCDSAISTIVISVRGYRTDSHQPPLIAGSWNESEQVNQQWSRAAMHLEKILKNLLTELRGLWNLPLLAQVATVWNLG